MDYFGLCLDGLNLVGQGVMHIAFVSRFTGKRQGVRCFFAYFLLLCILEYSFRKLSFSGVAAMGSQLLVLYGISRFAMGNLPSSSCAASILALYTSWLSFGLVNSAEAVVLPNWIGEPFLYLLLFLATLSAFGVCACCYGGVLKLLPLEQMGDMPYIGLLLLPGLFFTAAELYILHTSYSTVSLTFTWPQASKHAILLLLQALGLGALLCTLYAYRRICQGFQAQASLDSLAQAAEAQKIYIAECDRIWPYIRCRNAVKQFSVIRIVYDADPPAGILQCIRRIQADISRIASKKTDNFRQTFTCFLFLICF